MAKNTCTKDGWVITTFIRQDGGQSIHSDSKKAWRSMCDECRQLLKGHQAMLGQVGSKEPPEIGENPRALKRKGRKYAAHENVSKAKEEEV